ncbi:MAG: WecB/TagA/CpsF family glycosyltransferase [Verrucomicrobiota bacterium]|nr:WecB/TagA/CpsF family glycosyltransferase [Verrucomicrobiota bacterium]
MKIERVNVLGVGVSAINLDLAKEAFAEAIAEKKKGYVCVRDIHGIMQSQKDAPLRAIHNQAFLCTPDGMPLVWLGKLNGFKKMNRVYGPDLMLEIFGISAAQGFRHFFYGGANGAAQELKNKMEKRFPALQIVGIFEPPFRPLNTEEEKSLQQMVAETKPDIMWIGLSTHKQEKFMAEFLPKLETTLMVGVGAAFDFHSGRIKQAPRWIQRSGFEWFYRVCSEPRRLGRRYLKNVPLFMGHMFCQLTGLKKYSLPTLSGEKSGLS